MRELVILGIGEYAQVAHFYFTHDSQWQVAAFTVDKTYLEKNNNQTFCDLPVVPFEEIEQHYPPSEYDLFIAIGYANINKARAEKCQQAIKKGYKLATYVSSKATTWPGLNVGDNCFIFEDNTIQPFTRIGHNVVLWSGNHIGHHTQIGDNCFITSHAVISGGVKIGNNCFIGVNATFRDHITIGENCIIAAGALVTKDLEANGIYMGQPAKFVKAATEDSNI